MQPWQVSVGLSIVVLVPLGAGVMFELNYLSGYWSLVWGRYGYHLATVVLTVYFVCLFGIYQITRSLSLGDVGSRISVLDRTIRAGRAGDPELSAALQREASGDFES